MPTSLERATQLQNGYDTIKRMRRIKHAVLITINDMQIRKGKKKSTKKNNVTE